MKVINLTVLIFILLTHNVLLAQKPKTGCIDAAVEAQAKGIKLGLSQKGMKVFQEATFKMESLEPVPVAVKMVKGVQYELVFVGNEQASKLIMEVFDGKNKKVDERIERSMNNIIFSFVPAQTDVYLITLYQKRGLKDICGYFGVFMKGEPATVYQTEKKKPAVSGNTAAPLKTTPAPATVQPAPAGKAHQSIPDNQRPNPNRTRATIEAQQQKGK